MKKLIVLLLICFLLGCGAPIDKIMQLEPGMTKEAILESFGNPDWYELDESLYDGPVEEELRYKYYTPIFISKFLILRFKNSKLINISFKYY